MCQKVNKLSTADRVFSSLGRLEPLTAGSKLLLLTGELPARARRGDKTERPKDAKPMGFFKTSKLTKEKEIKLLQKSVRKMMKIQEKKPTGIADIKFTIGIDELDRFSAENEDHRANGDPHFVRLKNDIGANGGSVVLWYRRSADQNEFLTDLRLASTQTTSQHFFFGDKEGFRLIVHPNMRGMGRIEPTVSAFSHRYTQP